MRLSVFYILMLFLFSSCESKDMTPMMEFNGRRLLIAYLAGDNSLTDEIEERKTALSSGFELSLQSDPNDILLIFQDSKDQPTRLTEISAMGIRESQMMPAGNLDAANPDILQLLIERVSNFYQVDSYGLILFSHGTAWIPQNGMQEPEQDREQRLPSKSVIVDQEKEMELIDFANAVKLPDGHLWDFIIFENCYMGSVEVAYELKDVARTILASPTEVLSPGMMPIYKDFLPLLFHEKPDLAGFAESYFNFHNQQTGAYRSASIAVVNTAYLDTLCSLAARVLNGYSPDEKTLKSWQHYNRNQRHYFFDLEEILQTADPACQKELSDILAGLVSYKASTPEFAAGDYYEFKIDRFCGLSCYFPQSDFVYLNDYHKQTAWGKKIFYKNEDKI